MARIAWMFRDYIEGTTLFMAINPNEGASPEYMKGLSQQTTTAPDGRVLVFEGAPQPQKFDFSGVILEQAHYEFLYNAWKKRHPIEITDDLGRVFQVYFESFSPKREVSGSLPWRHTYSATTVIVS
jgi:hypothetical protein